MLFVLVVQGGGTFLALCSFLTGISDFEMLLEMTSRGDYKNVDMLVGDIYGSDYSRIGLSSTTIASSLAKINMMHPPADLTSFRKEDIAASVLRMISNNIAQISFLNASVIGLDRIFFSGYFVRDHIPTIEGLTFSVDFWSQGRMEARFLQHEGFVGALGALLSPQENEVPAM